MKHTFEDYLQEIHGKQYIGTDDDMPEDFNGWLGAQDINDIVAWAEKWGKTL